MEVPDTWRPTGWRQIGWCGDFAAGRTLAPRRWAQRFYDVGSDE